MIGIDFDNTIVCYDEVFVQVAVEQGLVPPQVATSKTAVRDYLRSVGQEDLWTELQGTIYGPRMMDARPFPGVREFFVACRAAGLPVAIVSHRTRFPYRGPRHDLHEAARDWLVRHGFHDPTGIGLPVEQVFFEETKEAKLARIAAVGCNHFIDDLPELLAHPLFPADVQRVLFDPHGQHGSVVGSEIVSSWPHLLNLLVGETTRLPGGGNTRVDRIDTAAGPVLLKEYFRHAGDMRDRLGAEQAFLQFAWAHGVRAIPKPLACDRGAGIGIYEFLDGRKLTAGEVTAAHVDEAAALFTAVNRHRHDPDAARLPIASEACFSLAEHLACVDRRLARLGAIEPESDLHREAAALVAGRLVPAWQRLRAAVVGGGLPLDAPLAATDRVISPSDFGFHNSIVTPDGLKFIDFEYAGWDDPAKTVCDFFCQPAVPVAREHVERFVSAMTNATCDASLRQRVALLFPVYELKWCCIMLNEFLPVSDDRRMFAHGERSKATRHNEQLKKVEAAITRLHA